MSMGVKKLLFLLSLQFAASAPALAQLSVSTIGATEAAACFQNANDHFSSNTKPCDDALKDATTTRRDRMKTYVNRGIIHNRIGSLQLALDDFNAALEIDDELGEAYLNRGNSWYLAERYDDALSDYERSLALDVAKPWAAWYNIGLVHDARKESDKAQEAYKKALEINPNFTLAKQKIKDPQ